jgi:hypothetical protein
MLSIALGVTACGSAEPKPPSSAASPAATTAKDAAAIPNAFRWSSSEPLISVHADATHPLVAIKDPSIVYAQDRWHVFATTASTTGAWSLVYLSFGDWSEAAHAEQHHLGDQPGFQGYHAAPEVFFFRPQNKWYLIFQSGQPQYSTTTELANPATWTEPVDFFARVPESVREHQSSGGWLDFWNICDEAFCYLFFADDNGELYRSRTRIQDFPRGFDEPVIAIQGTKDSLYEASATYRLAGTNQYLTLMEAVGPNGHRYFRSFVADRLDGSWTPLAATWESPFAGSNNVTFPSGRAWTADISHGELLRTNYDETPTVALSGLRFLYQGVRTNASQSEYSQVPWQLGLLTRLE